VEGGVAYAEGLGLKPHPDYERARVIFGDLDNAACSQKFEYGSKGKPLYISGPNETEAQAQAIVDKLRQRVGEGNFDFIVRLEMSG
jgi:hypothetical protein